MFVISSISNDAVFSQTDKISKQCQEKEYYLPKYTYLILLNRALLLLLLLLLSFAVSEQLVLTPTCTDSFQLLFCVVCSTGFYLWRSDAAAPGRPLSSAACRSAAGRCQKGAEEAGSGSAAISTESVR